MASAKRPATLVKMVILLVPALLMGVYQFPGVPAGAIVFLPGATCPPGWSEYTAARGRVIVGVPSGGTVAGTLGTALTDVADATITPAGTVGSSTFTGSEGTTSTFTGNTANGTTGITAGSFDHNTSSIADYETQVASTRFDVHSHTTSINDSGHVHSVNHNHTVTPAGTNGSSTFSGSGGVSTTPYVQLLVCKKDA